ASPPASRKSSRCARTPRPADAGHCDVAANARSAVTARRSAPREPEGGEGSSKEARKGGGKGGGIGGGKAADEVASRASATPGRIIVPDAPTIIRPAMDPTLLPGEPADDGFLALPPDRL